MAKLTIEDYRKLIIKIPNQSEGVHWRRLKDYFTNRKYRIFDLNPEFQRDYVWTQQQKIEFLEYTIKMGDASANNTRYIYFNEYEVSAQELNNGKKNLVIKKFVQSSYGDDFNHILRLIKGIHRGSVLFRCVMLHDCSSLESVLSYLDLQDIGQSWADEIEDAKPYDNANEPFPEKAVFLRAECTQNQVDIPFTVYTNIFYGMEESETHLLPNQIIKITGIQFGRVPKDEKDFISVDLEGLTTDNR